MCVRVNVSVLGLECGEFISLQQTQMHGRILVSRFVWGSTVEVLKTDYSSSCQDVFWVRKSKASST